MWQLQGQWCDGQRSRETTGTLQIRGDGVVQCGHCWIPLAEVRISERLTGLPDVLHFPDGESFSTRDHVVLDAALSTLGRSQRRWVRQLELRWRIAAVALLLVMGVGIGGVRYGLPALVRVVAFNLPPAVQTEIGRGVLAVLDRRVLDVSEVDSTVQERLQAGFAKLSASSNSDLQLQLLFRKGMGSNAFALPDGSLVLTDGLVKLAEHDEELLAVLAHEIGHVKQRHALRGILQAGGTALVLSAVFGDLQGVSAVALSAPTALAQLQFSRDLEREADAYAAQLMRAQNLPARRFTDLLVRLSAHVRDDAQEGNLLRSHPVTPERVQAFEQMYAIRDGQRAPTDGK